jgi:putative nucleotidyltransferase with HDIG domain
MNHENGQAAVQMQKVLESIDDLKPLPVTVSRALQLLQEPDATINQIVAVLSKDQAIAARLLKLSNSAYYGRPKAASTLHEAVMRLGFRRTKNLLFALSYSSLLSRRVAGYNMGDGELWQHSVAVAMVAPRIAERVAYPAPDEAYIAGLLHDIGKLMLDQYFNINWEQLQASSEAYNLSLIDTEELLLGMNHAQVGGALAEKWELPACLVEAIAHHHRPENAENHPDLAAIVHIANVVCKTLDTGFDEASAPNAAALEILALTPDDFTVMKETYSDMLDQPQISNRELAVAG